MTAGAIDALEPPMSRHRGLTLVEVLVVIATAVVLAAVLLVVLGPGSQRGAKLRPMPNSVNVRGIHMGMVLYAQGNNNWYPGIDAQGNLLDAAVETRLQILLEHQYFTADRLINPAERRPKWMAGPLTSDHYSYALLSIAQPGGRRDEWRQTNNTEAVMLSDRAVYDAADQLTSVNVTDANLGWRGSVGWNDNHVTFESRHVVTTRYTAVSNRNDDLFTAEGPDDAWMIHSGE
jgi:hypothetical protein